MTFKPQAIIWMEDTLLADGSRQGRAYDRAQEVLTAFENQNVPMAVVTHQSRMACEDNLRRARIGDYFAAVFSTQDYEGTTIDPSLTKAFAAARNHLGTTPGKTVGVVSSVRDIPLVRYAGLPVVGFTGGGALGTALTQRDDMTSRGAFTAASSMTELYAAISAFRPAPEARWHNIATPDLRK